MSEKEKGAILNQVHKLPPLQKERALGFMQGLAAGLACSSDQQPDQEKSGKEARQDR